MAFASAKASKQTPSQTPFDKQGKRIAMELTSLLSLYFSPGINAKRVMYTMERIGRVWLKKEEGRRARSVLVNSRSALI